MNTRLTAFLALCLWLPAARAADAPALCATPEQAKAVAALYAQAPSPPPFMAAPKSGVAEAVLLSALPADKAVGTTGAGFTAIWESLQGWDRSLTLVLKGGHVFEIHGPIMPGEPSKTSSFFNLKYPTAGLGGHLRRDLIAAIYAVSLQGREGPLRGVTFLDANGDNAFNVFLPESRRPDHGRDRVEEDLRHQVVDAEEDLDRDQRGDDPGSLGVGGSGHRGAPGAVTIDPWCLLSARRGGTPEDEPGAAA